MKTDLPEEQGGIGVYYFCKTEKCSYFHKTQNGAEK